MKLYVYYWQYGMIGYVITTSRNLADSMMWNKCQMIRPMIGDSYQAKAQAKINDFRVEEIELTRESFKCFI